MTRCDWCIGFIRRDCDMMRRCVKSGLARTNRVDFERSVEIANAEGGRAVRGD